MTVDEAYELTLSIIEELQKSGIKVEKIPTRSRTDPEIVNKYDREDRIKPEKWYHVTFYPANKTESRAIHEKARYLGNLGITFDTGGNTELRDWELDWSFRCGDIPDAEREKARDIVEDIIDNLSNSEDTKEAL